MPNSFFAKVLGAFLVCGFPAWGAEFPACGNILLHRPLPPEAGIHLQVAYNEEKSLFLGIIGDELPRRAYLVAAAKPILGTQTRVLTIEIATLPVAWSGDALRAPRNSRTLICRLEFVSNPPPIRVFSRLDLRRFLPAFPRPGTLVVLKHTYVQWVREDLSVSDLHHVPPTAAIPPDQYERDRAWGRRGTPRVLLELNKPGVISRTKIANSDNDTRELDRLLKLFEDQEYD